MTIDVIPIKKMPRSLSLLSYKVRNSLAYKIKIGQIVRVPLRNSIILAVVASKNKKLAISGRCLKNVLKIINDKPLFTKKQIKLFLQMAEYYFISASLFTYHSYPKILNKEWKKIRAAKEIKKGKTGRIKYFWWREIRERNKFYKKFFSKNRQILVIVPRILEIDRIAEQLAISKYNRIHAKLKRAENIDIWGKCLSGEPGIYIGTRSAIFYPFTNLQTIIIDEEESVDHKQYDMNPRYDVRIVGQKLAKLSGCNFILSSNSPSAESYYYSKKQLPSGTDRQIIVQDLKNEFTRENYSFIAQKLEKEIRKILKIKKQIFLFINKKGESSNTMCKDCNFIFSCKECGAPLARDSKNKLRCYFCRKEEEIPPFCPRCHGANIYSKGLGIEKIKKNLLKIFPKVKAVRIDKTTGFSAKNRKTQIIIGTEFALDKIIWKNIGLIAIINTDQLWGHIESSSGEKAFALLSKILTMTDQSVKIIIQTFSPGNYIIKSIRKRDANIFYKEELNNRRNFSYPPFAKLIKLSVLNKSEKKVKKEADRIYQTIIPLARNKKIKISYPLPIIRRKIRGKFKYNIIIKLKNLENFRPLVKKIPNNWLIDVGPKTLFD